MKVEKHKALGPRILVKVDPLDEMKKTTIQILESTKDRESTIVETGEVVDIGSVAFDGFGDGEAWINVGDKVCFLRHAGHIRKINGVEHRILNDTDLLTLITYEEVEEVNNANS